MNDFLYCHTHPSRHVSYRRHNQGQGRAKKLYMDKNGAGNGNTDDCGAKSRNLEA